MRDRFAFASSSLERVDEFKPRLNMLGLTLDVELQTGNRLIKAIVLPVKSSKIPGQVMILLVLPEP